MIVTPKFVFIHMHKTGGQTLIDIIKQCLTSHQSIGYHYPYYFLPAEYSGLPIVGFVRNPWDWYVSWYAFNHGRKTHNPLFHIVSDGGQADFYNTVSNLVNLGSDEIKSQQYREALIWLLPETLEGNTGVGITKNCVREYTDNSTGYYSWLFKRMYGDINRDQLFIGKFERLQEDFINIMMTLGVEKIDSMNSSFASIGKRNASRHADYSFYYDEPLRDLISQKEKLIVDKYKYKFEVSDDDTVNNLNYLNSLSSSIPGVFRKLLGMESNYLLIKSEADVTLIKEKLAQIPENTWQQSGREQYFEAHQQTQALLLIYDNDFRHYNPTYQSLYPLFESELQPLIGIIANFYRSHYQLDGFIVRLLFARLKPKGQIAPHLDKQYSLVNCHRIHIPIVTNEQNIFMVGGEKKVLRKGEIWEINNATIHAVTNNSDEERIHLILDWIPNSIVNTIMDNVKNSIS